MSNNRVEDDSMSVFVVRKGNDVVAVCNNYSDTIRALVLHDILNLDAVNAELKSHQSDDYYDLYSLLMTVADIDELDDFLHGGSVLRIDVNEDGRLKEKCAQKFGLKDYLVVLSNGEFHKVKASFPEEAEFMFFDEWSNYNEPEVIEVSEYSDEKLQMLIHKSI